MKERRVQYVLKYVPRICTAKVSCKVEPNVKLMHLIQDHAFNYVILILLLYFLGKTRFYYAINNKII